MPPTNPIRPVLVDTKTAAKRTRVEPATVRNWVRKGWLKVAIKEHGRSWYMLDDVLEVDRRARRGPVVADAS